jgi:hypothetical protein
MSKQDGFDEYATESAGFDEPCHSYYQMHQQDDEITHPANGIKTLKTTVVQLN